MESNTNVVTMLDVLEEENELRDQANAVLAGSDEKNCNGIVKRQALYSCLTCAPEAKDDYFKAIGVCLACSNHCHSDHDLVELYTKRNFRCDCGLKGEAACQLDSNKVDQNHVNSYNQNFSGIYCVCHRPYPDPENESNDEMIQCIVCEDWFHSLHLKGKTPNADSYAEMICGDCMMKNQFLYDYSGLSVTAVESEDGATGEVSVVNDSDAPEQEQDPDGSLPKKIKLSCTRPQQNSTTSLGDATFWRDNWRVELCNCADCVLIYTTHNVSFLSDPEDTAQYYEEMGKGKEKPKSSFEASIEALGALSHVNQINAISSYNSMKERLFEFLQTFVVNNQIVQEEDIQRFFRNMKDNNKDNNEQPHQPHFCR